jgi:hypothetical protein
MIQDSKGTYSFDGYGKWDNSVIRKTNTDFRRLTDAIAG